MNEQEVFCSFCNEEFPSPKAMGEHLMMCGNKTDQCPNCRKFVRRAIFAYHYENDCANPDAPTPDDKPNQRASQSNAIRVSIKCPFCNKNYNKGDGKIHKENCLQNPNNVANQQQRGTQGNSNQRSDRSRQFDDSDDDANIPCEYCNKPIEWHCYEDHTKVCRGQEPKRIQKPPRRDSKETFAAPPTVICKFCAMSMSRQGISYHEMNCRKNPRRNKN